jgi:hypothetical protein
MEQNNTSFHLQNEAAAGFQEVDFGMVQVKSIRMILPAFPFLKVQRRHFMELVQQWCDHHRN